MHELAITQSVVEAITERLGDAPVVRVRLEIGALSGILPDAVRFCFDLVAAGSPLAGARLEIDHPPGAGRCRSCHATATLTDPLAVCASCGSTDIDVVTGTQLRITEVEFATSCAPPAAAPTTPAPPSPTPTTPTTTPTPSGTTTASR
jgi:hydrogenase nickel incorporation protein HypA/HybF